MTNLFAKIFNSMFFNRQVEEKGAISKKKKKKQTLSTLQGMGVVLPIVILLFQNILSSRKLFKQLVQRCLNY
jgi:hypothetical protein